MDAQCWVRPLKGGWLLLQALAELLTTNKLSELACLTLYLMYEKKNGKQSVWYEFIKVRTHCSCAQFSANKHQCIRHIHNSLIKDDRNQATAECPQHWAPSLMTSTTSHCAVA